MIKIIEVEYSCSPGGKDEFEVYLNGEYCDGFYDILDAIDLAYLMANKHGLDIHIHTLAHYHATYDEVDSAMSDPFAMIPPQPIR